MEITNGWTPIDTYIYAVPAYAPRFKAGTECTLSELPLANYPPGTTLTIHRGSHGIEPGAYIGYSGSWSAPVIFPGAESRASDSRTSYEIGVPFAQAVERGLCRTADDLVGAGLWK